MIRAYRDARRLSAVLVAAAVLGVGANALAQLPTPRLVSVYPTGARQGSGLEVTVTGKDLVDPARLYFSHPGITCELIPEPEGKPPRFKVAVARDVPVGVHDVRFVGKYGASNPRAFVVGDQEESLEQEPNNERTAANRVSLNSVVCGQMNGGEDLDWFVFTAQKGQRVLIECWAWRIDSRLDGSLFLYDAAGKQLAVSQDDNSRDEKNDPLLDVDIPADGEYFLRLSDFLYGGGQTYGYRLRFGMAPLIDFALPTGARPGETTPITLYGRNLPGGESSGMAIRGRPLDKLVQPVNAPADPLLATSLRASQVLRPPASLLNAMEVQVPSSQGVSNPRLLLLAPGPESLEIEPNNTPEQAQRLTLPAAVSGQFGAAKDLDYFVFSAKKDERLEISVTCQRIGSPADPDLEVQRMDGNLLANPQDDGENIGQIRFTTSSRDIRYLFNPPGDGDYRLRLEHLYGQVQGGPQFVYRLEVAPPRPDFQLICQPTHETQGDNHVLYRGGRERLDVLVWRLGGHEEPITISARNLPPGVTMQPVTLWPKGKWATLVLEAALDAPIGEAEIEVVGVSQNSGAPVERLARGGVIVVDTVNTPAISRVTRSIVLAVRDEAPFTVTAVPSDFHLQPGQPLELTLQARRRADMPNEIQLASAGMPLPNGLNVPIVKILPADSETKLQLDTAKLEPGRYSFIINGEGQVPFEEKPGNKRNIRCVYPTNSIQLEVLPKEAGK
jgi:hypothetical protein